LDKDLFDSYGKVYYLKRGRKDKDKDEDPSAGSDQGLNKRKMSKEADLQKALNTEMPQDQGGDVGNTEDQPNVEESSKHDWTQISICPQQASTTNKDQGRQVVPANYLFNNDLEYLKGGSLKRKYTTSTTKTKAAKYDTIEGIEDMVSSLWSPVKYDYGYLNEIIVQREDQKLHKFVEGDFPRLNLRDIKDMLLLLVQKKLSILERDDLFNLNVALRMFTRRSAQAEELAFKTADTEMPQDQGGDVGNTEDQPNVEESSKHDCNPCQVVMKYDYGYLNEIIVQREDQKLHKFVEGDFPRLNLRDIKDMLLLLVQKKLSILERDDLFNLNVALRMFTRRVVILKRKDEESFDPIVQTPKNSDDEGNDDASLGLNVGGEEGQDAEDDDEELYRDININLEGRDVQMTDVHTTQEFKDTHVTLTSVNHDGQQQGSSMSYQFVTSMLNPSPDYSCTSYIDCTKSSSSNHSYHFLTQAENEEFLNNLDENIQKIIKEQVKEQVKVQVSKILPMIEKTVNEQLEAEVLTRSSNSSKTSYVIIIDTYGDTVTLKRCRDDMDKDKEPSVGSDRGSKRRREGKEPESTSAPKEKAKTTGKSTQGSKSHQKTASESVPAEEPMQTTQDLEEPLHQEFETGAADDQPIEEASQHPECDLAKQADSRSSFNELMDTPVDFLAFLMNRLKVDTLTPELLAVIPFDHFINNDLEYLRGGASSRKYTTSVTKTKEADYGYIKWIEELVPRTIWRSMLEMSTQNVESSLSPNFRLSNGIITSIWIGSRKAEKSHGQRTLCFQRLSKNVHKKHRHPTACGKSSTRKSYKERAAVMIQAIDKQLKMRRIMRSLEKFVGGRLYEGDFEMLQRTI
nr:hypothetical protein [Tanacetum cinerariifolium]